MNIMKDVIDNFVKNYEGDLNIKDIIDNYMVSKELNDAEKYVVKNSYRRQSK